MNEKQVYGCVLCLHDPRTGQNCSRCHIVYSRSRYEPCTPEWLHARNHDATVYASIQAGGSPYDLIATLAAEKADLARRLVLAESRASTLDPHPLKETKCTSS